MASKKKRESRDEKRAAGYRRLAASKKKEPGALENAELLKLSGELWTTALRGKKSRVPANENATPTEEAPSKKTPAKKSAKKTSKRPKRTVKIFSLSNARQAMILRTPSEEVTPQELPTQHMQSAIDKMIVAMREGPGVGLAAPQIGVNERIIVVEDLAKYQEGIPEKYLRAIKRAPVPLLVLINPVITWKSKRQVCAFEGCLSDEGGKVLYPVMRSEKIKISALDREGNQIFIIAEGWLARILQHEIGHLGSELSDSFDVFGQLKYKVVLCQDRAISGFWVTVEEYKANWRGLSSAQILRKLPDYRLAADLEL